ncbi:hypothetical protein PENSPDRAFT_648367 [Peniophora sp. CONT]|nr:hypothetical protein PENSPDRAFT_648367 [Peniophora sp. CONT]
MAPSLASVSRDYASADPAHRVSRGQAWPRSSRVSGQAHALCLLVRACQARRADAWRRERWAVCVGGQCKDVFMGMTQILVTVICT